MAVNHCCWKRKRRAAYKSRHRGPLAVLAKRFRPKPLPYSHTSSRRGQPATRHSRKDKISSLPLTIMNNHPRVQFRLRLKPFLSDRSTESDSTKEFQSSRVYQITCRKPNTYQSAALTSAHLVWYICAKLIFG